jgi:hypothetical protein
MKKLYLARIEVNENCPYYVFLLYAKNLNEAEKKVRDIAEQDYEYVFEVNVDEVKNLEDVKNFLLIKGHN